jgi:hypothetical protein
MIPDRRILFRWNARVEAARQAHYEDRRVDDGLCPDCDNPRGYWHRLCNACHARRNRERKDDR